MKIGLVKFREQGGRLRAYIMCDVAIGHAFSCFRVASIKHEREKIFLVNRFGLAPRDN